MMVRYNISIIRNMRRLEISDARDVVDGRDKPGHDGEADKPGHEGGGTSPAMTGRRDKPGHDGGRRSPAMTGGRDKPDPYGGDVRDVTAAEPSRPVSDQRR